MSIFNLSRRAALCFAAVALSGGLPLATLAQDKRPFEWIVGMAPESPIS